MMLIMQVCVVLGVAAVIYAVFGMFTSNSPKPSVKQKIPGQLLAEQDPGREQKIQRLESQIAKLENQLAQTKVVVSEEKSGLTAAKEKEAEFSVELKRREEWVAKAEAELTKARAENLDLQNKFLLKEKELEEEFTKNVNLARQARELKTALETSQEASRLKEDQLEAQKHQNESQLKKINEYLAMLEEFKRKEKISEWVPKQEFNQLNQEYTKLEKDLEASQERLKSFAAEIAHLRAPQESKPPDEAKPASEKTEEKTEKTDT